MPSFPEAYAGINLGFSLVERRYGSHLSKEEVEALVAPHPDTVSTVEEWLAFHDVESASIERSPAGDWRRIRVSACATNACEKRDCGPYG